MTIFSKIINREIPAEIVYEDDLCLAFKDIHPQAPVHILLVPKKEITSLAHVKSSDKELLGHMLTKIPELARAQGILESGFRIVANTGESVGQTVFHLHFHLLGGREFDSEFGSGSL